VLHLSINYKSGGHVATKCDLILIGIIIIRTLVIIICLFMADGRHNVKRADKDIYGITFINITPWKNNIL
jgi:hypothetical protein